MDNPIVWNVYNLIRTVPEGVVVEVCCNAVLIDGEYKASSNVSTRVPYQSPSSPGFIPFDQLTEAETVQWVKTQMGPENVNQVERGLYQTIAKQKVQTAQGVPW